MGDERDWVFDEEFVRSAKISERSGAERIGDARRVAAGHEALRGQRRRVRGRWRWPILIAGLGVVVMVALLAPQAQPVRDWLAENWPEASSSVAWGAEPELYLAVDGDTVAVPDVPEDAAGQPLGSPQVPPEGEGGYVFAAMRTQTDPVAFDPCRPIHVVTNDALAPPDGQAHVERALAVMSAATGLRFVLDGPTDEPATVGRAPVQPDRYGDRWAPVLLAWTSPAQVPELAGDVLGVGGGAPFDAGVLAEGSYSGGVSAGGQRARCAM